MKFTEMNLEANLLKAVEEAGFAECFPVQEETFRRTLHGRDVTVQSQTGSGKTAAFLITIFQKLGTDEKYRGKKALVIVPTRELATQIEDDARKLGKYLPYRIGSFFGGIGYGAQETLLRQGVDIMIGTPGRLIDFSRQKKIDLQDVGILVIDEADRLFDMGFLPDLRKLLRKMPPAQERLTMLLSATLGLRVSSLAWEYMNGAEEIEIDPEQVTVETITQEIYHVSSAEKMRLFLSIMKKVNPRNAIIFTNTKHAAEEVSKRMQINGYESQFIIGDLPQKKRLRIIDDMKEGAISFLVATDVAARGLHVDDLDLVVNYDVPEDAENYVHRIGRTARVGKSGLAVTLACEKYVFGLEAIEKYIGQKIPVQSYTEEDLAEDRSAGMKIHIERYGAGRDGFGGRREERGAQQRGRPARGRGEPRARGRPETSASGSPKETSPREAPARREGFRPNRQDHQDRRRTEHPSARGEQPQAPRGKMDKEERLVYYQKKYGEDFGGGAASFTQTGGGKREPRGGAKPGRQENARRGKHNKTKSSLRKQPSPRQPEAKPREDAQKEAKKPGLFGRILGFFTKK
jgi:ATP-dependent RNA helicase RhlB